MVIKRSRKRKKTIKLVTKGKCIECDREIDVPKHMRSPRMVSYRAWCEHHHPMHRFLYGAVCPG